jgi:hypothetical protein
MAESVVIKFETSKWIQRDEVKGYWHIGPRTYLELSSWLKDLITNNNSQDDNNDNTNDNINSTKMKVSDLPQIILY